LIDIKHRHFIVFKPFGFLSQFKNNRTRKKRLLSELFDFPENTMAIGRLDADSEGLLFLTTDGKTSEFIRSNKIEKEYWVQVDGLISDAAVNKLKFGVEISIEGKSYITKPCEASKIETPKNLPQRQKPIRDERHGPTSWIAITITEGKFRQVRKMTAAVGFPTLRLIRYRIGNTTISNLNSGSTKEVENFDQ